MKTGLVDMHMGNMQEIRRRASNHIIKDYYQKGKIMPEIELVAIYFANSFVTVFAFKTQSQTN